jgi:bifunctional DNA-binding transcriptional regulator/antitoxin component of YhaV-PrlF toxin-antitoxin module
MSAPEKLRARVSLNKQGRIVIPVALRHALGVKPGLLLFPPTAAWLMS